MQKCAEEVRCHRQGKPISPLLVTALVGALGHQQTFAREAVADALGAVHDPVARDALLDEAIKPNLPAKLLAACARAIENQLSLTVDVGYRNALRFLLIRASRAATTNGNLFAGEMLLGLALGEVAGKGSGRVHTAAAVEVITPSRSPGDFSTSLCETDIDPEIATELRALSAIDVGSDREQKFRVGRMMVDEHTMQVGLSPTTWSSGRRFHLGVQEDPRRFLRRLAGWVLPVPLGDVRLPGLVSVHVILLTSDRLLLCAQRPATSAYAPSHWSMSFEEQVTSEDLAVGNDAFAQAARRGAYEEFGVEVDLSSVWFETMIVEMEILNTAAVVLMKVPETLEEIKTRWSREPRPRDANEAVAIAGVYAAPEELDRLSAKPPPELTPMHPTSAIRCMVLARYLRRRDQAAV